MISVEIQIDKYSIIPHQSPDGRIFISILRCDNVDHYGNPHGPEKLIEVEKLFANEPSWSGE